ALKRSGYNGVLSIEFEGMEDVLGSLRIGLANLRRLVELA
ncbi:MAG: sugar phosphate isomerase/epimerase, partial [Lentisphaerae bacterium]|nr:sugar phosphate isomerase/epimerase [Lentisphaerota bacterium]